MSQAILELFESSTREFCSVASAIPVDQLEVVHVEGEWPASYVIHHLADADAYFLTRYFNVLSVDKPAIVPFDESQFPKALRYAGRTVLASIAAIQASAALLVEVLSQLSESEWERTGVHAERGELTLSQLLQVATNHRIEHIDQLKK
jgi:hypothetical protein